MDCCQSYNFVDAAGLFQDNGKAVEPDFKSTPVVVTRRAGNV